MTDIDDGVIRFSPATDIELRGFTAPTSIGPVETPVLWFTDERLGDVAILLNPADGAIFKLTAKLVAYIQSLVDQAEAPDAPKEGQ